MMKRSLRDVSAALVEAPSVTLLFMSVGVWLASLSWVRPLTLPDEGRYGGVAWEMLRLGSGTVPLLDGMPYFHKPPLFYWLAQLSFGVFGVNEWAARLPSWLAAWLAAMALYLFVRRYRDATVATVATIVLATQPFFFAGAQFANLDMLVAGLITLTILAGAAAAIDAQRGQPWRRLSLAAAAFAGLAVLAKGLIGLVLPGGTLLVWLVLGRRWKGLGALLWPTSILVFALVAVPWFWLMQQKYPGFFDYFFVYQHFKRFAETGFNNVQPAWFYIPVIGVLTLPWSPWCIGVLRKAFWRDPAGSAVRGLMAAWIAVVVVFFSLPSSKLIGYVAPALPPLAVLMAEGIAAALRDDTRRARRRYLLSLGIAVGLCVVLVGVAARTARGSAGMPAQVLAHRFEPGDTLVMLRAYQFDLRLSADSPAPAWVVDDWDDPALTRPDNWRKELFDAARFDPEKGKQLLVTPEVFRARLCAASGRRFWIWSGIQDAVQDPILEARPPYAADERHGLWRLRIDADFMVRHCAGMPTGG